MNTDLPLDPSNRIDIISKISDELSQEDWSMIDLTLRQFQMPTSDNSYNNNQKYYIIDMIDNQSDEKLISLASHLNIYQEISTTEINPTFWRVGHFKLFISHLATDKKIISQLKNSLEQYSITSFVAHEDIEPTKEWQDEIELGLKTCDCLLAFMTSFFHESKWTDQEIGVVVGRDKLIIPVKNGLDPYGFIGKYQAIPFTEPEELAKAIFQILLNNKKSAKQIAYALLHKLENSESYDQAKINISLLEKITYWDRKIEERLNNSIENNSQIRDAFYVPRKIQVLIESMNSKM